VIIFDCNGVLVDSEPIAAVVAAQEFQGVGIGITPELVARYFTGRRPADMFAEVEAATGQTLPANFSEIFAAAMLRRLRVELRATAHVKHALTWLRGPKCVASSSPIDRVRISLQTTGLIQFFEPNLFSASQVSRGKPAPDLFLLVARMTKVAPRDCIVVEDSPAGVAAAHAAGMMPIGFVGGGHANPHLGTQLTEAGARALILDMRALKQTVVALRGY
jgi:HAD superfamily hydrolase (TIGR01509 family)